MVAAANFEKESQVSQDKGCIKCLRIPKDCKTIVSGIKIQGNHKCTNGKDKDQSLI